MTDVMTGKDFLANAVRWLEWVQSFTEPNARLIAIAESKPAGLDQNGNLILDSEGGVWESVYGGQHGFRELTRDEPFAEYRPTGRIIGEDQWRAYNGGLLTVDGVTFVAKGWNRQDEDWSWVPARYGMTTLQYALSSKRSNDAGVRLGEALLALTPEALDEWAKTRSKDAPLGDRGRAHYHIDGDWQSLTQAFGLPSKEGVPDCGSMLCYAHLIVDHAAGLLHTSYAF